MTLAYAEDSLAQFDRLPPHSVESEMCLLASMVMDPDVREECVAMVRRDDWFQADHQIIYDAIAARQKNRKPIDWMLLRQDLEDGCLLEEIGGMPYLAQIASSAPSAAHGAHYASRVVECSRLRQIIAVGNEAVRGAYSPGGASAWETVARKLADDLLSILNHGTRETIRTLDEVLDEALERKLDGKPKRVPTGLADLDRIIGGLPLGRTTVVGARPGVGKSQLGKQLALNVSRAGVPVGIVSLEEDRFKIADNVMSNASGVENNHIAYEKCDQVEWRKVMEGITGLRGRPFYLDDQQTDLSGVLNTIGRMVTKHRCQVIVVDYLQLINPSDSPAKAAAREQEVRQISNGLKMAFKRLNVAGVVTAQLNRAGGNDPPELHHLRESGAIEQDGDLILLLHREDYYHRDETGYTPDHTLEIGVAKNKDGPLGTVRSVFDGSTQSIYDHEQTDPFA